MRKFIFYGFMTERKKDFIFDIRKCAILNRLFFMFFLLIFSFSCVYSLGVSPARTTLDFTPNLKKTIDFDVFSSSSEESSLAISVRGNLSKYIKIYDNSIVIKEGEKQKRVSYEVNLPERLEPGLHTADIFVVEIPKDKSVDGSGVVATLAVVTQLYVYVPYPGKYALAQFETLNSNKGGVDFVFSVVSAGEFDLKNVYVSVDIFDLNGKKVDSFSSEPIEIKSGQKREIVKNWGAGYSGDYVARASVIYDEGTINLNKSFSVGETELVLKSISANKFSLGEIVQLDVLVENKWNNDIKKAYVEGKILNEKGVVVSKFESAVKDIAKNSKESFAVFWNTAGVRVGTYDAEIELKYADKSFKNSLKFVVEKNKLTILGLGYVVKDKGDESDNLVVFLIIIILILILINLFWFLVLRKKLKK